MARHSDEFLRGVIHGVQETGGDWNDISDEINCCITEFQDRMRKEEETEKAIRYLQDLGYIVTKMGHKS